MTTEWRVPRALKHAGALVAILFAIYWLREALLPIGVAWVLAYHLLPVVRALEKRGLRRGAASGIVVCGAIFALVACAVVVMPFIARELGEFAKTVPNMVKAVRTEVLPWIEQTFGVALPQSFGEALDKLPADVRAQAPELANAFARGLTRLLSGTASAIADILGLVIIPILTFFFLREHGELRDRIAGLIPERHREWSLKLAADVDRVCASFLRGKVIVSLILATIYSIGLSIAGVPMALTLGVVAGILNFVPYLGLLIGLGLSLAFSFLALQGWGAPVGVVVTFAFGQLLDNFVLSPLIVGDSLGLSPLAFLIALMVGGAAFGMLGLILAVPAAAVLKVWGQTLAAKYRASAIYTGAV